MEQAKKARHTVPGTYGSVAEFYPFYLSQHASRTNRRLHFVGTSLVIGLVLAAAIGGNYLLLLALPLAGYSFAWVGHFAVEKNKPATFEYPFYSLACDFLMYRDMLIGRLKF
jgi:hypothetical protein